MKFSPIVLLDGAMGTMLQSAGLPAGAQPELWNLTNPEAVTAVQRQYVEAGSQVLYANTFGANRLKLSGTDCTVADAVSRGISAAKAAAAGADVKVALDIGPLGQLMAPMGTLTFSDAYDMFREMVLAGVEAGADLAVIETMSDLNEVRAAVLAVKENSSLPVWVTMTFEASGRTFVGTSIASMALTLEGLGVDAMGFNCSLGPKELLGFARELRRWTSLPLILKPNAGLPDAVTGQYAITPEEFAEMLSPAAQYGVSFFGGCCGTGPDFIRALKKALSAVPAPGTPAAEFGGISCAAAALPFPGEFTVGCGLCAGQDDLEEAIEDEDTDAIQEIALDQADEDPELLAVCLDLPDGPSPQWMAAVVNEAQSVTRIPLLLTSADPDTLEAGLRNYSGKAAVRLAAADPALLSLCRKYGAAVLAEAAPVCAEAAKAGIPAGDIYLGQWSEEEDQIYQLSVTPFSA